MNGIGTVALFIGVLFLLIAWTGKPGSMAAALLAPGQLVVKG